MKFKFYFYGSSNSIDKDVIISISRDDIPYTQEGRKVLLKSLDIPTDWNSTLVVIESGIIVDTIYPKAWIDSLNNSVYNTYDNHIKHQLYPNPIERMVDRNVLLSVYKTLRTILTYCARTDYRTKVKPILKGCHDFNLKLTALSNIEFNSIINFNQPNGSDSDIWKTIAFYLYQNISLINGIEIYSKNDCIKQHPQSKPFILREELKKTDIDNLQTDINMYIDTLSAFTFISDNGKLKCDSLGVDINMMNETF